MSKRLGLLILLLSALAAHAEEDSREVVLVVSAASPVMTISSLELRKLYLGLPVRLEGILMRPLRNDNDDQLQDIFFQSAMAMSEAAYERQLLSLTLRFGRLSPESISSTDEVKKILREDISAVSYMWKSAVSKEDGLRVVKLLWREH